MTTTSLARHVHQALATDQSLTAAALTTGFITLKDLDPACPIHVNALIDTLRDYDSTYAAQSPPTDTAAPEIPHCWLQRMDPYRLWRLQHHPAVAAFLAAAIHTHVWDAPVWTDLPKHPHTGFPDLPCTHGPFAPAIQAAFLAKLEAHPYPEPIRRALHQRWLPNAEPELRALLPIAEQTLAAAKASQEAQRLARARAARIRSRRASRERRRAQDPLVLAIASGKAHQVNRFALEHLDPARLAALLPAWLAAPADVQACLLRVPELSPEDHAQALAAWASMDSTRPNLPHPVPADLLTALPAPVLARVLREDLCRPKDGIVRPPITEGDLDGLLLCIALSDPSQACTIRQAYSLRAWHHRLTMPTPNPAPAPPADPEATWVLTITQLPAWPPERKTSRAILVQRLFESWPPERQAALAAPLAAWMKTVPYLP